MSRGPLADFVGNIYKKRVFGKNIGVFGISAQPKITIPDYVQSTTLITIIYAFQKIIVIVRPEK